MKLPHAMVILAAIAVTAAHSPASEDPALQQTVEHLLKSKKYSLSHLGIAVTDLSTNASIFDINGDTPENPASVSKLLTAAVALDQLGPGFCFSTHIFIDSAVQRDSGVTAHNLYIQGGGDPGFTAERLWLFVEHLYHSGLRRVTGDLVLDDFFFDSTRVGPGFDEDATSESYVPFINALAVNFNTIAVHSRPGAEIRSPIAVDLFPEMNNVKITSTATTVAHADKESLKIVTAPDPDGTVMKIRGTMGLNEPGTYEFRKLWQTWNGFGSALLPLFARRGITVNGRLIHGRVPPDVARRGPFYVFESEPLPISITRMFKYSSNFTAEMLFKTLSAQRGDTIPGSWEKSAAIVTSWWQEKGLPGSPVIKNGSGMGNTNRISPSQIVALLSFVWNRKAILPDYLAALPAAGIDGTLKSRFAKSNLKGRVRAKTGTLNNYGIGTLAGYVFPESGGSYAFAFFCHKTGHGQYDDWMMEEQVLEKVFGEKK